MMVFHFHCNIYKIFAEGHNARRNIPAGSLTPTMATLPREIHGAPLESFVVKLSEIIGKFKTLRKMGLFWFKVVAEVSQLTYLDPIISFYSN